jgi:hypothetical protein
MRSVRQPEMNRHGTTEIVLAPAKATVLARLLFASILLAWLAYRAADRQAVALWAIFAVLFVSLAFVFYLPIRMLITGQAIVITDRGLIDCTSGWGFIGWNEIRGAEEYPYMGVTLVALNFTNLEAVLRRLSPVRRWLWRYYLRKPGRKPTVPGSFVQGGAPAVVSAVNAHAVGGDLEPTVV